MDKNIGFIGLGIMGKPMAVNLLKAGYRLFVFDINERSSTELELEGAKVMQSPKELAEASDTIITILPDSPQVKDVTIGGNGLIDGLSEGKLYIDMSTIDAATAIEINGRFGEKYVDMLDAPVSGGEIGAVSGSLSIMVGGEQRSFERALPLFDILGKRIMHMGKTGSGQLTKSCSQIATALTTQGIVEAFSLARHAGVDLSKVREALLGGFAESKALDIVGKRIIVEDFSPGFKLSLYHKDLRIAQHAAARQSLSLPGTALLYQEMEILMKEGKGELDFSALIDVIKR